ncbi:hypothetical protein HMPREF1484_00268 [Dermabacter sp. HFH0086]|uniref:GAF domain-containing protein n=1 Tax=Dermabacter TaxID=36739 RepID=UPI0003545EF4|nr:MULTISPECIES: GAF domain-containing protein [Dermabacter]EPH17583.1 hypothetical protein HMPREF1484_00268 [Dermabacter sp. HFH0086]
MSGRQKTVWRDKWLLKPVVQFGLGFAYWFSAILSPLVISFDSWLTANFRLLGSNGGRRLGVFLGVLALVSKAILDEVDKAKIRRVEVERKAAVDEFAVGLANLSTTLARAEEQFSHDREVHCVEAGANFLVQHLSKEIEKVRVCVYRLDYAEKIGGTLDTQTPVLSLVGEPRGRATNLAREVFSSEDWDYDGERTLECILRDRVLEGKPEEASISARSYRHFLSVPMVRRKEVVGMICADSPVSPISPEDYESVLRSVGLLVAMGLDPMPGGRYGRRSLTTSGDVNLDKIRGYYESKNRRR